MSLSHSLKAEYDVIIVGGGIGGLTAAERAIELGQRVLVLEKLDRPGGSAAMSAGILWTAPNEEVLAEVLPGRNPELCSIVVSSFDRIKNYVAATGVAVSPEWHDHLGWGRACKIDVGALIDLWADRIATEGRIEFGVRGVAWGQSDAGKRTLTFRSADGKTHTAVAPAVVLATGGIQGDPLLRQTLIGGSADTIAVRSNRGSVGDGFYLGQQAGAAASAHLAAFYGHTLPSPLAVTEEVALRMTMYFSNRGVVLNRNGRRFSDETLGDEVTTQRLVCQPDQRGVLIWDDAAHVDHALAEPYPSGMVLDRHEEAEALGARTATADTLEGLLAILADWGLDTVTAAHTLANYRAAAEGEPASLDAPVAGTHATLSRAPFRAIELQPCITLPFGGLSVDADARLLDRDGEPVPGLYAIGGDAGGMQDLRYIGGIIFAMVFGQRAAEHVSKGGH